MIINADDFGYSPKVNDAVCECFRRGLINRTTVMVNMPFCEDALKLARENGFLEKVGLHLNLTEGRALSEEMRNSPLCDENGIMKGTFHIPFKARIYLNKKIRNAIYAEAVAQMEKYFEMGFKLKHMDSHNYTHTYFSVWTAVSKAMKKYGFDSTRISRNVSPEGFSFAFAVYKNIINFLIRNFKVGGKKLFTSSYFCSVQDFEQSENKEKIKDSLELMTHPVYIDGVLTDNTLPKPHPFRDEGWLEENRLSTDGRIKLLVCFIQAHIGGAMTSLVNFVNALDTKKYDVDLMFYECEKGERYGIKEEINILPQGKMHKSSDLKNLALKLLSPSYVAAAIADVYYKRVKKNRRKAIQIMSKQGCRYSRPLDKEYDIAVAYEFTWAMNYVTRRVKAKKKIIWNHVEYEKSGMDFKVDKKALDGADALVFVSDDCRKSYNEKHPEHKDKTVFIPNLLSSEYLQARGNENITLPFDEKNAGLVLITVARISFEHKGFDRAVRVFSRLKKEGLLEGVKWLVVGEGRDEDEFFAMIESEGLSEHIFPVGVKENPIPWLKHADAFLLPSRHEGKPMVITESFIMGVVPMVTAYTSAYEQIRNGIDGLVFENSEEGLYKGLKKVLENPGIISALKAEVEHTEYGNTHEIREFDKLAEKLM